jgi:uncharacterized hydrophobic protein (TIGR00341 family)
MALRFMEIVIPEHCLNEAHMLLEAIPDADRWEAPLEGGTILINVLLPMESVEELVDDFERRFSSEKSLRLILLPVEAALPRDKNMLEKTPVGNEPKARPKFLRISREELYQTIDQSAGITPMFLAMVVLSSIVAAVGLLRDNGAAVIGAMVIAPLLGPNAGLALATTLADKVLAQKALMSNLVGVAIAFFFSVTIGFISPVDIARPEIAARIEVNVLDIALALAAGITGSLAFTTGVAASLIGVMVAVALLPPTIVFGMLVGSGEWSAAFGAMLLLAINVTAVNLSGVGTFYALGIKPRNWWAAQKAKQMSRVALVLWVFLLAILAGLIFLAV